jgi:hypothetical protein
MHSLLLARLSVRDQQADDNFLLGLAPHDIASNCRTLLPVQAAIKLVNRDSSHNAAMGSKSRKFNKDNGNKNNGGQSKSPGRFIPSAPKVKYIPELSNCIFKVGGIAQFNDQVNVLADYCKVHAG